MTTHTDHMMKWHGQTRRVIFKCPCKHAWGYDYTITVETLPNGGARYRWNREEGMKPEQDGRACPACGNRSRIKSNIVEATYSADHKCTAQCKNATGSKCLCECGGKNHGVNHL